MRLFCVIVLGLVLCVGGLSAVGATGSLSLDQLDPHVNDVVTFTTAVQNLPKGGNAAYQEYVPFIEVTCFQGTGEVVEIYGRAYPPSSQEFQLSWPNGGAASCQATLFYDRVDKTKPYQDPKATKSNTLATIYFLVSA